MKESDGTKHVNSREKRLFTDESVIVEAFEDLLGETLCTEKKETGRVVK